MSEPLWKFEGCVTAAGNQVVQNWYWDEIDPDDRDTIRDRISYLKNVGNHLWKEPYFESLGDIGEIKKRTPRGALRVYGCFLQGRTFLLLHGVLKKVTNDRQGKAGARERLKKLNQKEGSTHEFQFEEKPA